MRTFELSDDFVEWGGYSYRLARFAHNLLVSNGYGYHLDQDEICYKDQYQYQIDISLSDEALVFLKLHGINLYKHC